MTKDIVSKLRSHLGTTLTSECGVVYLLAEVRKLLERDDPKRRHGALWMYCHWGLHVDLSYPDTTEDLLKRIDVWVSNTVAYLIPTGPRKFMQEYHLFKDFIYLETFRIQLRKFLECYDLPTDLCTTDERWFGFLSAYGGVIEDGSLTCVNRKQENELYVVNKVTFTKGAELSDKHHVNFVIRWKIDLRDGRTLQVDTETVPDAAGNMTLHGLQIINNGFVPPEPPQSPLAIG